MSQVGTGNITPEVNQIYQRDILVTADPLSLYNKFAMPTLIPYKSGTQNVAWRRYDNLDVVITDLTLTEGQNPEGQALTPTNITATVGWYGGYIPFTEEVEKTSVDNVLMQLNGRLAIQAARLKDFLTRDVLVAGTQVWYGGTAGSRVTVASGDDITTTLLESAILQLKNNNTSHIKEMINATTKVATTPVKDCYVAIVHTNIAKDIKGLTGFQSYETYSSTTSRMPGEFGAYEDIRFLETTDAKIFEDAGASSVDVYATIIFGKDAYGTVSLGNESVEYVFKDKGVIGGALERYSTTGYKLRHVAKILNNNFMTRIEHTYSGD